jgi:hypothetical protein
MEVLRQKEIQFRKKVKIEREERKRALRELKEKRRRDAEAAVEKAAEVAAMAAQLAQDDVYVPTSDERRRAEMIAAEEAENQSTSSSSSGSGSESGVELEDSDGEDSGVGEDAEGAGDEFDVQGSHKSGGNSRANSRPSSAGDSTPGFAGMGRRLSSKLFSAVSRQDSGTGQLQRRPSMFQSFVGSFKGTPLMSRANSMIAPAETDADAASGQMDLAEEATQPLPASKPPLFAKMVSRLSGLNLDVGVATRGRGDDDDDDDEGTEEAAAPVKKARSSRFSLFGGKKEEKVEVAEVAVDYRAVTLEDVLRVLPMSVQCVDMKEAIAKDALIVVSVQDVPYVYNYQALQFKKAAAAAVEKQGLHGFNRPGSVSSATGDVTVGTVGIASGAPSPAVGQTSPVSPIPEIKLPAPNVPKLWPITDRAFKSHSLEKLMDEVDKAHLTAQYAADEQDLDDQPRAAEKAKPVMWDGKPLPELTAQQTEYLKDKIQLSPNYSRHLLDTRAAEMGGEKEVVSCFVMLFLSALLP